MQPSQPALHDSIELTPADTDELERSLAGYEQDRLTGGALCELFRLMAKRWPGLPSHFHEVLETLLHPLESSALFSEESCAFSRTDLAAALRQWLQAAMRRTPLGGTASASVQPSIKPDPTE